MQEARASCAPANATPTSSPSPTVTDMTRDVLYHVVVRFSQAPTVHFLLPRKDERSLGTALDGELAQ